MPTTPVDGSPPDSSALNPGQREAALQAAADGVHDVLVIGAGATGAGCALDAAGRGLSTVLVEAGDFAAGTSSRSGKTFHGGLRYLEQLNFSLVRTALRERDLMVGTLCPYLTQPEPFLFPITRRWQRLYLGAGIALYDALTLTHRRTLKRTGIPHHRHFSRRGTLRCAPALDAATVRGGIQYFDVRIDDARHAMILARTAAELGARVIRSAPVVDFLREGGRVSGVVIHDERTHTLIEIRARAVISATGIWAQQVQQQAGAQTFRVTPAKGIHLIFERDAVDSETGIFARAEDSVIILRKWWNYWMLGTTDTAYYGDYRSPRAENDDIEYLLRNINRYLARKLTRADIVGTFAGLRPLLAPAGGMRSSAQSADPTSPGDLTTSALARDHSVLPGPPGLITVVGGKYTTYRVMAADAVDAAARQLSDDVPPSRSDRLALVGTRGWEDSRAAARALARRYSVTLAHVERLVSRYGGLTEQVLAPSTADPALARALPGAPGYLGVEYLYAVTHEGAMTLEDVLWHRTHVSFETADGGVEVAPLVAAMIAPALGWDLVEQENQIHCYLDWITAERAALDSSTKLDPSPVLEVP